ncbi:MAG TPA: hypothetical protein VG405_01070 [Solirubrobacteraceae bacterium]|nr:hypothetical protein [Solirubrobacteraceae bacterium]
MVDSRIYRSGLALVAVAVIVFAFSLTGQPTPAPSNLAPVPLNGAALLANMTSLAREFPNRTPGSPGDRGLAAAVASQLQGTRGFTVATATQTLSTARGERPVETVTAMRPGLSGGTIALMAQRDASGGRGLAGLSGTAVLLDLARLIAGQTESHTIMLVSTSASVGAAGAAQLAHSLAGRPVDAVIALGDLGAVHPTQPLIDPWSDAAVVAPPLLRQTISRYVAADTGLPAGNPTLGAQLAHLAFPYSSSEQGPFGAAGQPAVEFSTSGYGPTPPNQPVSALRLQQSEEAILQAVSALDSGPTVPPPSSYLVLSGQLVPGWAVRLLVLALLVPVAVAVVDAVARARRRGHSMLRWLGWVLASSIPFLACLVVLLIVRAGGLLSGTPPGPVAGTIPLSGGGIALMVVLAVTLIVSFAVLRPRCVQLLAQRQRTRGRPGTSSGDAAAVSLMVVLCAAVAILWLANPFTALLLVPALHLWLWLAQEGVRTRRWLMVGLGVVGLVPAVLVLGYYVHAFGLTPVGLVWSGILMVLGGALSPLAGLVICLLLGCAVSVLIIVLRSAPAPSQATPVTVRGPATYAGPGSLGGTESALSSRR